ncbi:MAG: CDP-diacylglycerol--glycerol-3-phosphate 3-phosphatidyltransferase [Pirellulales bacterium]|nr:CDP-diacylglycerol--glycerol-3-phosphate 3-phosphatidyltransferase [Pirellulales bacterium]
MIAAVWNLPNQLTIARLILAILLFCLIPWGHYLAANVIFCLAAGTDWLDGYLARKWGQVTVFGRILDPFVDKVLICGAFIMLAAIAGSGIASWMAVLVTGRELLVTTIRSFLEAAGKDFSAKWSGKIKMGLQCAAVIASLVALQYGAQTLPPWLALSLPVLVWGAVLSTVYSGVIYIFAAGRLV